MKDPVLGILKKNVELDGFDASVRYGRKAIKVLVTPEDLPIDKTLELARRFVAELAHYEALAKERAVDLLKECNEGYRDGKPQLRKEQFKATLELESLTFSGAEDVEFYFKDNDLFWGHSVIVQSFDGRSFTHATLFG